MALRQGGRGRPTRRPSRGFSPGPALSQLHAPHVLLLLPGTPSQHLTPPSSPLPVPPVQPRLKVSGQTRCCLGFSRLGGLPLLDAPRRPLPDTRHSVTDLCVCVCPHHGTRDSVGAPYRESCLLACPRHLAVPVAFSISSRGIVCNSS